MAIAGTVALRINNYCIKAELVAIIQYCHGSCLDRRTGLNRYRVSAGTKIRSRRCRISGRPQVRITYLAARGYDRSRTVTPVAAGGGRRAVKINYRRCTYCTGCVLPVYTNETNIPAVA